MARAEKTAHMSIKSRDRVRDTGEVFTQPREVKAMCDLCEPLISRIDKTVLEPTCGTGNFLVEILSRKLQNCNHDEYKILIALSNIYGVDIALDNLEEARSRMKSVVLDYVGSKKSSAGFLIAVDAILKTNICYGDMLKGKKKIKMIRWIPDEEGGFELERWTYADIEKLRANTTFARTFADIPNALKPPEINAETKKAKTKAKPKKQASLF